MMLLPTGSAVRIHIAAGVTDMRKGMDELLPWNWKAETHVKR